ncbi:hypothetical protein OH146_10350 [Salinibacterium sp. SYSU T00001]|uniref:hypothetical protein n=1 Tax=Homoserinimonas sedimenticola TaxID=2986805 RepID=UPI00223583F8|nr:hypothetical protein [Salinibacterium sedimenticola]MCW4386172.1 hypothetical protein [Salinibacterium sedimenticola]
MDWLVAAAIIGGMGAVMWALAMLGRWLRRRGTAGAAIASAMATYNELHLSSDHRSFAEMKAEDERRTPDVAPDPLRRR